MSEEEKFTPKDAADWRAPDTSSSPESVSPQHEIVADSSTIEAPNDRPREESSKRLMGAIEMLRRLQIGQLTVDGKEHLDEIPPDRNLVIATSHLADIDLPLAIYSLGHDLNMAVADVSLHHQLKGDPGTFVGLHLAGKENFLPVDYTKSEAGKQVPATFNPDNFQSMVEAMDDGKRVIIAAHNPAEDFEFGRPGYGAAYLAEISNALILPVAVRIESDEGLGMGQTALKTMMKRPDAKVFIGSPFELEAIPNINRLKEIMDKRKNGESLSHEEVKEFSKLKDNLQQKAGTVLDEVKALLPDQEDERESNQPE